MTMMVASRCGASRAVSALFTLATVTAADQRGRPATPVRSHDRPNGVAQDGRLKGPFGSGRSDEEYRRVPAGASGSRGPGCPEFGGMKTVGLF